MEKSRVILELHDMIHARLFGSRPWLAAHDVVATICKRLDDLGLQEPAGGNTTRATALGSELKLTLMMVFLGIFNEAEVPIILEEHGFLDDIEVERLLEGPDLTANAEEILRPIVQKAFFSHYNPSGRLH